MGCTPDPDQPHESDLSLSDLVKPCSALHALDNEIIKSRCISLTLSTVTFWHFVVKWFNLNSGPLSFSHKYRTGDQLGLHHSPSKLLVLPPLRILAD